MTQQTRRLNQAHLFAEAADSWALTRGILVGGSVSQPLRVSNNLSDLASTPTARINLGLQIGTDVQAHSAFLDRYATGSPSDLALALLVKTSPSEWQNLLGVTTNAGTVTSVAMSGGTTGLSVLGGPVTSSGTLTLSGTLSVANGGTGVNTISSLVTTLDAAGGDPTARNYQPPYTASKKVTVFEVLKRLPLTPSQFYAVPDFDYATWTGTDNTTFLQNMLNAGSQEGREIRFPLGERYLTGTLYAYYNAALNPNYAQRPGRIKLTGEAQGYATGALDYAGAALAHKDGVTAPLLSIVGAWAVSGAPDAGAFVDISGVNLLGGNQTTAVLYCEAVTDQLMIEKVTTRTRNTAGIGIDLVSCWKVNLKNVLNRGPGTGLGPNEVGYNAGALVTSIGLNVRDNGNGGQINMAVFDNVENYKHGYGTRVGRRTQSGTYGPLIWIGGQDSLCDEHGFWIDGGVYALTAIGRQIEQTRKNGLRIDSNGASDIQHTIKWQCGYFTHCGKMEDSTSDSFGINVVDGFNVEIDSPVFQNTRSGIYFDRATTKNLLIRRPELRTVSAWGASTGKFIDATSTTLPVGMNIKLIDGHAVNGTSTVIGTNARQAFALGDAGELKSVSDNSTTPSLDLGYALLNKSAEKLNFNNSITTTVTDILGGQASQLIELTFSNTNTSIQSNANIYLTGGMDFFPRNSRATLTLMRDSGNSYWMEIGRANGAYSQHTLLASASASSVTGTTIETTLASVAIPASLLGTDGRVDVDLVFSVTNSASTKTVKVKYGGSTFAQYAVTTVSGGRSLCGFANRGSANSQVGSAASIQAGGTSASAVVTMTVDSSASQNIIVTGTLTDTGETITLESVMVRVTSGKQSVPANALHDPVTGQILHDPATGQILTYG